MNKLFFWICLIAIIVYASQNHWFDPISNFFNGIKSDVENQRNYVPQREHIDDRGMLTVEEDESQVVRRSALGTVHANR